MVRTTDILVEFVKGSIALPVKFCKNIYHKIRNLWESRRPWGHYKILEDTGGRKIKTIFVKPGKRLSLQKHRHRAEYWLVASGCGLVRIGDQEISLTAGNSVVIPKNTTHRVSNEGKEILVFVEVQVGDYLEEDDIIRIDDDYGRVA